MCVKVRGFFRVDVSLRLCMLNIMGSVQEVDRKKGFIKKTERARQRKTPRSEREKATEGQ